MMREVRRSIAPPLTLPQFDVLAQLGRRSEGMTPGELTRALVVTPGNVTGIVRRLGRLGLVARRTVPEDRRAVRVVLTAAGRAALDGRLPGHRREIVDLLSSFPDRDLAALRELLGTLARDLEARGRV
jgi:DNA-binding MarR family transcriptional regulator